MVDRWNPDTPVVLGNEYFASSQAFDAFGISNAFGYLQPYHVSVGAAIAAVRAGAAQGTASTGVPAPGLICDITAKGSEKFVNPVVMRLTPNTATAAGGPTLVGGASSWVDALSTVGDGKDGLFNATLQNVLMGFNTSLIPTGKRIVTVGLSLCAPGNGSWNLGFAHSGAFVAPAPYGQTTTAATSQNVTTQVWRYEVCPWTQQPWTMTDLGHLGDGTYSVWIIYASAGYSSCYFDAFSLDVLYADENRLATGFLNGTVNATNPTDLTDPRTFTHYRIPIHQVPSGTAGLTTISGTDYSLMFRVPENAGYTFNGRLLKDAYDLGSSPANALPQQPFRYFYLSSGTYTGDLPQNGVQTSLELGLETAAGAWDQDQVAAYPFVQFLPPHSGTRAYAQLVTPGTTHTYAQVRFPALLYSIVGSVTVSVETMSGTVLGTGTVNLSNYAKWARFSLYPESVGVYFRVVTVQLAAGVTLTAGTQYRVVITCGTTTITNFGPNSGVYAEVLPFTQQDYAGFASHNPDWHGAVDPGEQPAGTAMGSGTDTKWQLVLIEQPPAVTSVAAVVASQTLSPPADICGVAQPFMLGALPYMKVTWDQSTYSAWGAYRVQRSSDGGTTWTDVARFTTITAVEFDDYEYRFNTNTLYQVAQEATNGSLSVWTPIGSPVQAGYTGAGLALTTNAAPSYNQVWTTNVSGSTRPYTFPESSEVTYATLSNRDYQVGFRPLNRRGVVFTRDMLVSAMAAPVGIERADALRNLSWLPISYVCVRDADGNRWFMSLNVTDGVVHGHDIAVNATTTFTQVTDTPAVVDSV